MDDGMANDKVEVLERVATVPYLLQLANLSTTLLEALSVDVVNSRECKNSSFFLGKFDFVIY